MSPHGVQVPSPESGERGAHWMAGADQAENGFLAGDIILDAKGCILSVMLTPRRQDSVDISSEVRPAVGEAQTVGGAAEDDA